MSLSWQPLAAQLIKTDIGLSFVKDSATISPNELFFNTLRVINRSHLTYKGSVRFSAPEDWRVIAFNSPEISLSPGDTLLVPFRVSPFPNATGGISYLVLGIFESGGQSVSISSYLSIPALAKWEFSTSGSSNYITDNYPYTSFSVKLSNKGNRPELVKLDYKLGNLLTFKSDINYFNTAEYIALPPFRDTVVTRNVVLRTDLTFADKQRYERNWKESSIMVTASNESENRSSQVQIRKLSSHYHNFRAQSSSPLNIDYNVYNLLSNQLPYHNMMFYGNLLFEHDIDLKYNIGVQNLRLYEGAYFDFNRQFIYNINYNDLKNDILLSYNTHSYGLHSMNGRGISGKFKISDAYNVNYSFIQNPFTRDLGMNVGVDFRVNKLNFNTIATHEFNTLNGYRASSLQLGSSLSFLKYHRLNLQILGSTASYNMDNGRDTTALGMSFKFNYYIKYKDFYLKLSGFNTAFNKIKNSGNQQYYLDAGYAFTNNFRALLYANRLDYSTTKYPYNFTHPVSFNVTDYIRMVLSYTASQLTYQLGPNYVGMTRESINSFSGFQTKFSTYQPGVWGSVSMRLDGYRSISPNITFGRMYVKSISSDPSIPVLTADAGFAYSVGVNYFSDNFKINAYYSKGNSGDLYRDLQIYEQPSLSRTLQVRPSYEEFIFNRKAKINLYVNYTYYLPSERQNIAYNARYEHFFDKGWAAYLSGHIYTNSRKDENDGRLTTMDMNFIAGIRKSFNIQQPRTKYYNLRTLFFNDLDGNKLKSDNEPPVANILVKVSAVKSDTTSYLQIPEIELVSNLKGEITIDNMPKSKYKMKYQPLVNLQSYYFLNGAEQLYVSDKDRVLYVPLVESYKVMGKVSIVRDPNSNEGRLDLDGIRISALSSHGEVYSVLTDRFGNYILNVPNADQYEVKITNVFGEYFTLDKNEVIVQFGANKTINLDFNFVERKRQINFGNGQLFNFDTTK